MPEICVAWTWESTSPLHVGSGLSQPGVADSLVQRDRAGNPIIPGEAVKGALRMAAEQVAAWLGEEQDYGTAGNAEPTVWPLVRLFGGEGAGRCTAATLVKPSKSHGNGSPSSPPPASDERPHVFTSTAIDRRTGTARNDTLRKTEFVPRGLRFEARYTAGVTDGETDVVETLLLAALAAVESVGGKAGIGWGRMKLVELTAAVLGEDSEHGRDPTIAVGRERLEKLKSALSPLSPDKSASSSAPSETSCHEGGTGAEPAWPTASRSTETTETSPASVPRWFKLTIELQEPTCLPDLPEFSNQVTTQDCIPATALRGALAGYWRRSGRSEADVRSWLSDDAAWTPAVRSINGAPTAPAPRSFVTTKRTHGKESPVHDTFRPQAPTTKEGDPLQWRSLAGGTIRWDGSKAVVAKRAERETRMHVARDYRTGSKRTGALYARESLVLGTRFVAWARVPQAAFKGVPRSGEGDSPPGNEKCIESFELLIGKRLSAGNGRAKVQVECAAGPEFFAPGHEAKTDSCIFVQLVSPAVIYDLDGYPCRTLDQAWWASKFGGDGAGKIELQAMRESDRPNRTAPGRRGGWMGTWRHARAAVTTIDAGSVWRLCCRTEGDAERLRRRLRERGRIGERTHEGFGSIVVDPPWLGVPCAAKLDAAELEAPEPKGKATHWPDATIDASELARIARDLASKKVSEENARAYQEIAARVRTAPAGAREARKHLEGLKKLCAERKARSESKWQPVDELLSKYKITTNENTPDSYSVLRERLRFELGILVTRGTAGRQ